MRRAALTLALLLVLGGCASSTIRSGEPPGRTAADLDDSWHSSFFFGTVPAGDAYELRRACPNGWAEIRLRADPFTLLAGAVTLFLYSPSRVTVVCARQPGDEQLAF